MRKISTGLTLLFMSSALLAAESKQVKFTEVKLSATYESADSFPTPTTEQEALELYSNYISLCSEKIGCLHFKEGEENQNISIIGNEVLLTLEDQAVVVGKLGKYQGSSKARDANLWRNGYTNLSSSFTLEDGPSVETTYKMKKRRKVKRLIGDDAFLSGFDVKKIYSHRLKVKSDVLNLKLRSDQVVPYFTRESVKIRGYYVK